MGTTGSELRKKRPQKQRKCYAKDTHSSKEEEMGALTREGEHQEGTGVPKTEGN